MRPDFESKRRFMMRFKLVVLLVGGVALMFGLGWVPTVKVWNGDTFEVTCRACSRTLSVGWGADESEPTSAQHQTGGAVSPSGATSAARPEVFG